MVFARGATYANVALQVSCTVAVKKHTVNIVSAVILGRGLKQSALLSTQAAIHLHGHVKFMHRALASYTAFLRPYGVVFGGTCLCP